MTERYRGLTRAQLNARLRTERDALEHDTYPEAERLERQLALQELELELENRDLHVANEHVQHARDSLEQASTDDGRSGRVHVDEHGTITDLDPVAATLLGGSQATLAGQPLRDLIGDHDPLRLERFLRALHERGTAAAIELQWAAGRVRMELLAEEHDRVRSGGRWVLGLTDVTHQRRAEADAKRHLNAIARAARANALGEMASGIAHELSQPLSAIVAYARAGHHLLQLDTPQARKELELSLEKVSQQAERAADIIRRIRGFVHKEAPQTGVHRVGDLLEHALAALEDELQENAIGFEVQQDPADLQVRVDAIFVEQVMVNLLRNAIDSILAAKGEQRRIEIRVTRPDLEWAEVCFSDTGEGMAGQDPEQWFMPFATSRRGSLGLSLSLSRSLVEAHGGRLWAEPAQGGGSTLRFTLPMASD